MKKTLLITGSTVLSLVLMGFIAFKFTPWPSALVIRYVFNKEGKKVNEQLQKHVPEGVSVIANLQYILNDNDAKLDVYFPTALAASKEMLPVIVWVHGGGWIAGSKDQISNYCKILAAKGYCVVATDYSLAPGASYPTPIRQTSRAIEYVIENAQRFHADTSAIVLAGDSGGAHIVAQVANIITDPSYGDLVGVTAPQEMSVVQLRGVLLYCGPYDAEVIRSGNDVENTEPAGGTVAGQQDAASLFLKTVLWSYMGKKNYESMPGFKAASVINYVTKNFPPSFISAGNGDPLLEHSYILANKLSSLNVKVDTLFFKKDHIPTLPHEYQFNLDNDEGKLAFARSLTFLASVTSKNQ